MLEKYYEYENTDHDAKHKRQVAVGAALEVAKASVSAASAATGPKSAADLLNVTRQVSDLADAIQTALAK